MDVKKTKDQQPASKQARVDEIKAGHKYWLGGYIFIALLCLGAYLLLQLKVFDVFGSRLQLYRKISLGAFFSFLVLIIGRIIEILITKRSQSKALRYNLVRAVRLLTVVFIFIVVISFLFQNWYTAAVSLGLISLILGFALQVPISSFIAWLYIIFRTPYRVGDRIEISQFKGDVVEISYLDTTLWEFGGNYLTNDMPSGRLIRFPNSLVLQSAVFNYSWPKFPYIWNEIPFHVAYESDLGFVEKTLKKITKAALAPEMVDRINDLKKLVKQTPVDELEIKEYPFVSFRINANTWVEVLVTYLVEPKQATAVRTHIIKEALTALLASPDKVMFPNGNSR
jgi:small-conductance mechanosensitive channel